MVTPSFRRPSTVSECVRRPIKSLVCEQQRRVQIAGLPSGNRKLGGITPTTVKGAPFNVIASADEGRSPPNRRCQKSWRSTTTRSFRASSSSVKSAADEPASTPRTRNSAGRHRERSQLLGLARRRSAQIRRTRYAPSASNTEFCASPVHDSSAAPPDRGPCRSRCCVPTRRRAGPARGTGAASAAPH